MQNTKAVKYIPLTEATYYILISLIKPIHGYGIMQTVEEMSKGRVKLGPGTLYGALSKLEKEAIIIKLDEYENDRRKYYDLTELGKEVIRLENQRLKELLQNSNEIIERIGGKTNG